MGGPLWASGVGRGVSSSITHWNEERPQGSKTSPGGRPQGSHPRPYEYVQAYQLLENHDHYPTSTYRPDDNR